MASKKDVKSFFTERVEEWASNYAEPAPVSMNVQRLVSRKRFALELLEASTPREARVLDVGCATGDLTDELTRRGYDALGIDISEAMIYYASRRYGADRFRVGDIEQMPFPDNSFDALLCLGVVGFLETDVQALGEIERQSSTICLIPSENYVSRAVLEAMGSVFTNKYSEGYAAVAITRVSRWSIGL